MELFAWWTLQWTKLHKSLTCKGPKVYSKHDQLAHSTSALPGLPVCTTTPAQLQAFPLLESVSNVSENGKRCHL